MDGTTRDETGCNRHWRRKRRTPAANFYFILKALWGKREQIASALTIELIAAHCCALFVGEAKVFLSASACAHHLGGGRVSPELNVSA